MSRTESCGSQQSCALPPVYRYEEHGGSSKPATESKAPPDRVARTSPARVRLNRLSGNHEATDKFKGGQGMSPSPALEQDPRVQSYRWLAQEGRYQVTRYDPQQVTFTRSGRPLTGPTVKLDGRVTRLDDAIDVVKGRTAALLNVVKRLEDTPLGTKAILSSKELLPVVSRLGDATRHLVQAEALLRAGKPEQARQAFARGVRALGDASIKARTAQRQINNNVELATELLRAAKAAGEAAQVVLVATGAGAVGEAAEGAVQAVGCGSKLATAVKIVSAAGVKTAHSAASKALDQALDPDQDVDWSKVGEHAAKSMLWNLISGNLSERLKGKIAGGPTVNKLLARVRQKLTLALAKKATDMVAEAAKGGKKSSPRQVATWAMSDAESAIRQTLTDEGYDVASGAGKAIFKALVKTALKP